MKKILSIFLFLIISFGLVSCKSGEDLKAKTDKEVINNSDIDKKENIDERVTYNVDWEKCIHDTKAEFTNSEQYSYLKDIYIEVSGDKITFTAVLADSTDGKLALDLADSIIRRFNANAQLQDSSVKSSGKDYLGGLYDNYTISIGIAPLSEVKNQSKWYIYDAIEKKVHREPKLQK
ncbi:MAG: hypothetical protein E6940_07740 [Clostridium septicum]|uniref:hypothetical protein n=1 Tax=Clostridium septicum TaxID=1504 RepID=UPI00258ABE85|nr:hypothetical protein [Clostridium septicum]MDU1313941.1 hypothetical protein [Clostridium septicum]